MKTYYIVFGNGFVEFTDSDDDGEAVGYANSLAYDHDTFVQSIFKQDKDGEYTIEVY